MLLVPVPMGDPFGIMIKQNTGGGQQIAAPYWFFWVPLGIAPAPQQVSAEELLAEGLKLPDVPIMSYERRVPDGDNAELAALLSAALSKLELDDETRAKLIVALRKM
jgi:hypothetical protein